MQGLTIAVLCAAIGFAFITKPKYWIVIFLFAMALYPNFLMISLGSIDFNVTRILILILLIGVLFNNEYITKFKFILLDKLVILSLVAQIIAYAFTTPMEMFLVNRAGAVLDTIMPYFLVRLILVDWKTYAVTLKWTLILMAPMAVVGIYQSVTSHNPVGFFANYRVWGTAVEVMQEARHGFYRANFTFPMSIMFGLFFAMLGPACAGLLKISKKNGQIWLGLFFAALGTFSSMSSGPFLAAVLSIGFILAYKYRKYWKVVMWIMVIGCIAVEVVSNRHFYNVLCRFSFSTSTAWYRVRLIEVAFFEGGMSNHWLLGYGVDDPGWGLKIDYRSFTDIVNHYLLILCRFGLIGFISFIASIVEAIRVLVKSFKACTYEAERWMVWCMSAGLFGLLMTLNSVSLFGQPVILLYMMLAICGSFPFMIKNKPTQTMVNQKQIQRPSWEMA